jgi:hypothetical protein
MHHQKEKYLEDSANEKKQAQNMSDREFYLSIPTDRHERAYQSSEGAEEGLPRFSRLYRLDVARARGNGAE